MKNLIAIMAITLFLPLSHALTDGNVDIGSVKADICKSKATKAVEKWFDGYYAKAKKEAQKNLEQGEELNEDLLPGGLDLNEVTECEGSAKNCRVFSYQWGENEECLCGINVKGTRSKTGKNCKVKVDAKSAGCECG